MESPMVPGAATLARSYLKEFPLEATRVLESLPIRETARFLERQELSTAIDIIYRLTPDTASRVLQHLPDPIAHSILSGSEPGRAATLVSRWDEDRRRQALDLLDPRAAEEIRDYLTYPPDSAGRLMDAMVASFHAEATVERVLSRLRRFPRRGIHDIYVVDEDGRLIGALPLQDLAVARPKGRLGELMKPATAFIDSLALREQVVELLTQYRLSTLPVVDLEQRLLGVIRYETLVTAAAEEATADMQTMVGASKQERALSKISFAVRKRLPWLEINLGTAFLAAAVVGLFEGTIARYTALAVLLPVVAGQSGNTGAQALAVVMRGLALREVRARHGPRLLIKELSVGFLNGIAVAVTTSFFVYLWSRSAGLALVIGLSMVASMAIAGLAGAGIPILLTSLRQDPAQSSSIILTTVTDVAGFFSFLGIATWLSAML